MDQMDAELKKFAKVRECTIGVLSFAFIINDNLIKYINIQNRNSRCYSV